MNNAIPARRLMSPLSLAPCASAKPKGTSPDGRTVQLVSAGEVPSFAGQALRTQDDKAGPTGGGKRRRDSDGTAESAEPLHSTKRHCVSGDSKAAAPESDSTLESASTFDEAAIASSWRQTIDDYLTPIPEGPTRKAESAKATAFIEAATRIAKQLRAITTEPRQLEQHVLKALDQLALIGPVTPVLVKLVRPFLSGTGLTPLGEKVIDKVLELVSCADPRTPGSGFYPDSDRMLVELMHEDIDSDYLAKILALLEASAKSLDSDPPSRTRYIRSMLSALIERVCQRRMTSDNAKEIAQTIWRLTSSSDGARPWSGLLNALSTSGAATMAWPYEVIYAACQLIANEVKRGSEDQQRRAMDATKELLKELGPRSVKFCEKLNDPTALSKRLAYIALGRQHWESELASESGEDFMSAHSRLCLTSLMGWFDQCVAPKPAAVRPTATDPTDQS